MPSASSPPRITLDVLAKRCGVAKSTVSRVLNNHGAGFSVLPEKRERILRLARELNYQPNVTARTLKTQQTKIVVILGFTSQTHDGPSIYPPLISRTVDVLQKAGYHVCSGFPHPERGLNAMLPWKVDGAIIVHSRQAGSLQEVEDSGVPYVTVNREAGPHGCALMLDEPSGIQRAMTHLFTLGHTRIAYRNTAGARRHYSVTQRHKAFLQACRERAVPVLPGNDLHEVDPARYWREFVLPSRATAVLAYSHNEALELLFAARRLGIEIPGQVSLMCFNDVYPCAKLVPSLTAMAPPLGDMGTTAGNLLLQMMTTGKKPQEPVFFFQEQLVARESTAPPPASTLTSGREDAACDNAGMKVYQKRR